MRAEIAGLIDGTLAEARRQAARTLTVLYEHYSAVPVHAELQQHKGRPPEEADYLEQAWATSLVGTAADIRPEVARYIGAGIGAFELKFIYHSVDHLVNQMRKFADGVFAHVR